MTILQWLLLDTLVDAVSLVAIVFILYRKRFTVQHAVRSFLGISNLENQILTISEHLIPTEDEETLHDDFGNPLDEEPLF